MELLKVSILLVSVGVPTSETDRFGIEAETRLNEIDGCRVQVTDSTSFERQISLESLVEYLVNK